MIRKKGQIIRLDTPNTTLVIGADSAEYLYYGKKIQGTGAEFYGGAGRRVFSQYGRNANNEYTESSVLLFNADGGFSTDFTFSRSRVLTEKPELPSLPSSYGEGKTLELKYVDAPTRVALYLYYTVFDDSDVIAVSAKLVNASRREIRVRRLMSLQLDLAGTDYNAVTFEGTWGRERHKTVRPVPGGVFVNDSKAGSSSHMHNPFVMAENERGVYAFNLVYSGNHKEIFEADNTCITRVLVGINDFMFDWALAPGEEFVAPEAVMCFAPDEDEMSLRMHAFVSEHIVRGKWKKKERPVLVNNWEGTYFDFNEEKLLAIATAAKEIGAELFVLDDGWFGKRDSDTCSLGDWYDNEEKTGGGLAQLAEKIRALGLSFGIWVEPEMISEDSDLYRAHPNYAMKVPGRTPCRWRNQLVLNMADEKVQNYVIRAISDVISRSGADYVKWDFNRNFTDCYGKGIAGGEYFHRYMLGYYRVVSKIMKKFPFVLFEGCAGGGGRFDLGNFCFFPQYWTSDDTDARERVAIQCGTSYGYPQTVMGAHVSACPNHQTGNSNPLRTRFNVACGGVLGYELDPTKFTPAEKEEVKAQIAFYKENRKLLQFGDHYRLSSPGVEGFMTVSKDKASAIAVVNVMENLPFAPFHTVRFKGLNPSAVYEVSAVGKEESFTAGGDLLTGGDFPLKQTYDFAEVSANSGCMASRMYVFRKVKN